MMLLTTSKSDVSDNNVVKYSQQRCTFENQYNTLDSIHHGGDEEEEESIDCLGSKYQQDMGCCSCIRCNILISTFISNRNTRNCLVVVLTTILIILIFILGLTVTVEDTRRTTTTTTTTDQTHGLSEHSSQQEILSYIILSSSQRLSNGVDFADNYKNHSSPQSLALAWVTKHTIVWSVPQHPNKHIDNQLKLKDIDLIPYIGNDRSLPPLLLEDYARLCGVLERYALAVFYYSVGGDSTILSTTRWNNRWMSNEAHICMWYGITCNTSKTNPYMTFVSDISLSSTFLSGRLPYELAYLRNLKSLDISNNVFVGSVPSLLGTLSNLGTLTMIFCKILTYGKPTNLKISHETFCILESFQLQQNLFTGQIPHSICQLVKSGVLKTLNSNCGFANGNVISCRCCTECI